MRKVVGMVSLGLALLVSHVYALEDAALFHHSAGLWQLTATKQLNRWIEIHNLAEAETTGIFHVEVIGREKGKPAWAIQTLCKHMAITLAALKRSVIRPLKSGAVYPESFQYAYEAWKHDAESQRYVCDRSVLACLADPASGCAAP
jgi:Domain of unknown function (DUF5086)